MEISLRMKSQLRQWKIARKTTVHYTSLDYYQTVVYTAIIHIFMEQLKWLRNLVLKRYMYMHSQMVEIHLLHQEKIMFRNQQIRWLKLVLERLLQFQDVTMQWIEIITGIELLRHMMLLQREKEIKLQTLYRQLQIHTQQIRQMNLLFLQ